MLNDKNSSLSNVSKHFYFIPLVQIKPIFCKYVLQSRIGDFKGCIS